MADAEQPDFTTLTVQLLTAYVSNNTVPIEQLPGLIGTTRAALAKHDESIAAAETPQEQAFTPAVSARKSLASPEHIVSMIDGKPYRTLKRHLATHGLTPADYRARYKLAADYPMVAPAYSEARRATAQRLGLGRKRPTQAAEFTEPATADEPPESSKPAPKRGRRKPASNEPAAS